MSVSGGARPYFPFHLLLVIALICDYQQPLPLLNTLDRASCADNVTAAYESLSDLADHSVLTGSLTRIEGHIIARQLFHARCRNASSFAVAAASKASVEVAACDAAEVA